MRTLTGMRAAVMTAMVFVAVRGGISAQTPAQPGQPHRIVVLVESNAVRIRWEVNQDVAWPSHRLDFSLDAAGPPVTRVMTGAARDISIAIPPGVEGSFWVTVTGFGNGVESAPSLPAPFQIRRTACTGPPAAPTNLSGVIANRVITLQWQPAAGAAEYWLEAGSAPSARDYFAGSVGEQRGLSAAVPANLVAFIRVYAQNACGRSGPSTEIRVADESSPNVQRWVGQTAQGREISLDIDGSGVRTVVIRGIVSSAVPQCNGDEANFPWSFNPPKPIVNGQVTLTGENPERTIAFRLTATFSATSASGTLEVTLRKPGAFCEGSLSTTWGAAPERFPNQPPPPPPSGQQIWSGTTAQQMPIEFTLVNGAIERVRFQAATTTAGCSTQTHTNWLFQPPVPIQGGRFELHAVAPPPPIANFDIVGAVTGNSASGTLSVTLSTSTGCVGTGQTTWMVTRQ